MATTALMIHLGSSIASINFSTLKELKTLVEILNNPFVKILYKEFFSFWVLNYRQSIMIGHEIFVQQVVNLVVINLEVAALYDEDSVLLLLSFINLFKQMLKTVDQDAFVLDSVKCWRKAPSQRLLFLLWALKLAQLKKAFLIAVMIASGACICILSCRLDITKACIVSVDLIRIVVVTLVMHVS